MGGSLRGASRSSVAAAVLAGVLVSFGSTRSALAVGESGEEAEGLAVELSALVGVAAPGCGGGTCGGSFDLGPSIAGSALFRTSRTWAFGIGGEVSRAPWRASSIDPTGTTQTVTSTVTSGLLGASARFTPLPALRVSPVGELTVGAAFQTETRPGVRCNDGANPGASLGFGGRLRLPPVALLLLAVASVGVPTQTCAVSDGPPVTPFADLSFGLLLGVVVDLGLGAGGGPS